MFYHQCLSSGLTAEIAWSVVTLNTAYKIHKNVHYLPVYEGFCFIGAFASKINSP